MDEVIAYYKMRVFNSNKYESPTNYIYAFSVYRETELAYMVEMDSGHKISVPKVNADEVE